MNIRRLGIGLLASLLVTMVPALPAAARSDGMRPMKKVMWASTGIIIREKPSPKGKRIASLDPGKRVEIIGVSSDGKWFHITYHGKPFGYVASDLLSDKAGASRQGADDNQERDPLRHSPERNASEPNGAEPNGAEPNRTGRQIPDRAEERAVLDAPEPVSASAPAAETDPPVSARNRKGRGKKTAREPERLQKVLPIEAPDDAVFAVVPAQDVRPGANGRCPSGMTKLSLVDGSPVCIAL